MTSMFVMTAEAAEAFFELCLMREAVKDQERLEIMQELVMAGRAHWFKADASKDEIITALAGSGYNVLKVGKNGRQRGH